MWLANHPPKLALLRFNTTYCMSVPKHCTTLNTAVYSSVGSQFTTTGLVSASTVLYSRFTTLDPRSTSNHQLLLYGLLTQLLRCILLGLAPCSPCYVLRCRRS